MNLRGEELDYQEKGETSHYVAQEYKGDFRILGGTGTIKKGLTIFSHQKIVLESNNHTPLPIG